MPRVVIGVGLAAYPRNGAGVAWAYGNWALGFRQAGWDVWLVERLKPRKNAVTAQECADHERTALAWWRGTLRRFGLLEQSTFFLSDGGAVAGRELIAAGEGYLFREALGLEGESAPGAGSRRSGRADRDAAAREEVLAFAAGADLFLNISGHFMERDILAAPRHRTYLDLDPLFTQVWAAGYAVDMHLEPHDSFATCGTRLAAADCTAPRLDRTWLPTLPPVSLAHWTPTPDADAATRDPATALTTVTHWHGYPPIEWEGRWYDNKMPEMRKLAGLPRHVRRPLEIAGDAHPENSPALPRR